MKQEQQTGGLSDRSNQLDIQAASQSASGGMSMSGVCPLSVVIAVQLYSNVDTVRPQCPTIIELLIGIFCFNVK